MSDCCTNDGTQTKVPVYYSVGEVDFYFADFDPPDMPADGRILTDEEGQLRPIVSATAELMNSAPGTISDVTVLASPVTVNNVLMEPGTAVKFKAAGLQVDPGGRETLVKILAVLSDGAVKPLAFRFVVEP
jgi:hypothetical protein